MTRIVQEALARYAGSEGALLPVLHAVQEALTCVPASSVPAIASGLDLSRADVQGVLSFYHAFRSEPAPRRELALCRAEACQAMGARGLQKHAEERLGTACGGVSSDGGVALEAVYCLGNCAAAPCALLDGAVHGRVDAAALDLLLGVESRS